MQRARTQHGPTVAITPRSHYNASAISKLPVGCVFARRRSGARHGGGTQQVDVELNPSCGIYNAIFWWRCEHISLDSVPSASRQVELLGLSTAACTWPRGNASGGKRNHSASEKATPGSLQFSRTCASWLS